MAIRSSAYLKRNRFGVYYFRRVIPPDLLGHFKAREVSKTTGTTSRALAVPVARRFAVALDEAFEALRAMSKKDGKKDGLTAHMMVRFELMDGWMKQIFVDAQPHEVDAAQSLIASTVQALGASAGKTVGAADAGPKLFAEIDKYLQEQAQSGNWRAQSELDIRGDFEQIKAILGDVPVAALDHQRLNDLKDALLRLPANMNKLAETRGKTIAEILQLGLLPQSPITARKKWARFTSFCDWLVGKGLIASNIAKGKKPKAKAQSYEKFNTADLKALFESDLYRSGAYTEAFQFWLPVLGLYTGARLEELAQLHVADVKQEQSSSIWFVEITEEVEDEGGADTGKALKNGYSNRVCPLHSAVLAAGFENYVRELKAKGYDRLFPELSPDALGKVGPRASEWFTAYRRACGVGASSGKSRKVFHSFRHTMNAALQQAGVRQEVREALCGHASKAINVRIYGGEFGLASLSGALENLQYDFALVSFQSHPEHESARQAGMSRCEKTVRVRDRNN